MIQLNFKTERIQQEWSSGNLDLKLVKIVELVREWLAVSYPEVDQIVVTDIYRKPKEQDDIYLNHVDPKVAAKYKKKPWMSVHQVWRGIDLRTKNMPKKAVVALIKMLDTIPYDIKRPNKSSVKYHDAGKGVHIHIQTFK